MLILKINLKINFFYIFLYQKKKKTLKYHSTTLLWKLSQSHYNNYN